MTTRRVAPEPAASLTSCPLLEAARECLLGECCVAVLGLVQVDEERDDDEDCDGAEDDVEWAADVLDGASDVVIGEADCAGPGDAAGGVEGEEARPGHAVGAGEEGGVGAEDGDEASDEDDLAAVLLEDEATDLQAALVEANVFAVAAQDRVTAPATEREADVVADDRASGGHGDDDADREPVCGCRVERGGDQCCFAGERDADALEADECEHGFVAVVVDPVLEVAAEEP